MIYEFRTYTLKPGATPEVEAMFAENLPHREKFSKLTAFWHTEVGPLNQIIHVWEYKDVLERVRIREESAKDPHWPPPIGKYIAGMESEIFFPFPGSPELKPGSNGPVYEMRSYIVKPGTLPKMWELAREKLPERETLSPLTCMMYTDSGPLNKFMHIWAYKSMDERMAIRGKAVETGKWPPATREFLVTMENKIMLPASFSPLQ
jgi:hypothetical protein